MNDKVAAAILVQTIFASNPQLQQELRKKLTVGGDLLETGLPQAAETFLRPWYQAALALVEHPEQKAATRS